MHDGAGAWLKNAIARACLAGEGIHDAEEFFSYCVEYLSSNATGKNFTRRRHFYLVPIKTIASYRAEMVSKVTSEGPVSIWPTKADTTGYFFWATKEGPKGENKLYQRRTGCYCDPCQAGNFGHCEHEEEVVGGVFNECHVITLKASEVLKGRSVEECKAFIKKAKRNQVTVRVTVGWEGVCKGVSAVQLWKKKIPGR